MKKMKLNLGTMVCQQDNAPFIKV